MRQAAVASGRTQVAVLEEEKEIFSYFSKAQKGPASLSNLQTSGNLTFITHPP